MASLKITPESVLRGSALNISFFNEFRRSISLELCTQEGRLIRSLESTDRKVIIYQLNTLNLESGTYLIVIREEDQVIQQKFIVIDQKKSS